jgi:ABC-type Fe3+/spermidine/putrescine transport system ATPase subunit
MVSHDPADTLAWADEIIVLKDGNAIQHGTPQQIYREPVNEYVAGLFGTYNLLTTGQQKIIGVKHPVGNKLVRPEEFRIRRSKTANRFHIEEVRFCGNLYELKLTYRQWTVWVATTSDHYSVGDKVEISLIRSRKN